MTAPAFSSDPRPVSPGRVDGAASSVASCPIFSFSATQEASSYELAVLQLKEGDTQSDLEHAEVSIRVEVPAGASTWSPSLEECLVPGREYAWVIRAHDAQGPGPWSEASWFSVPGVPTDDEVRQALSVLERHRHALEGRARSPEPFDEGDPSLVAGGGTSVSPAGAVPRTKARGLVSDQARLAATPDAVALSAVDTTATGINFGVHGVTASTTAGAAGVVGVASGTTGDNAGVQGQTDSADGTAGSFDNSAGGDVLRGLVNGTEVFAVDGTGQVHATAFVGDGSGLTGLSTGVGDGDVSGGAGGTIVDGSITQDDLADNSVTGAKVIDGSLSGSDIVDGSISGVDVLDNSLSGSDLVDHAIQSRHLDANVVTGPHVRDGSITADDIATGAITSSKIANNAVSSGSVVDGSITASDIANGAVTNAKIASNSVKGVNVIDGSITAADLGNSSVVGGYGGDVADGTIGYYDLAVNSIYGTRHIVDGSLSGADIAIGSLTGDDIAAHSIPLDDLQTGLCVVKLTATACPAGTTQYGLRFDTEDTFNNDACNSTVASCGSSDITLRFCCQ